MDWDYREMVRAEIREHLDAAIQRSFEDRGWTDYAFDDLIMYLEAAKADWKKRSPNTREAEWEARHKPKAKISAQLRKQVMERDEYRCRQCSEWRNVVLHIDHIYPESLGGPTILENLQVLCARCNTSKGAKA